MREEIKNLPAILSEMPPQNCTKWRRSYPSEKIFFQGLFCDRTYRGQGDPSRNRRKNLKETIDGAGAGEDDFIEISQFRHRLRSLKNRIVKIESKWLRFCALRYSGQKGPSQFRPGIKEKRLHPERAFREERRLLLESLQERSIEARRLGPRSLWLSLLRSRRFVFHRSCRANAALHFCW